MFLSGPGGTGKSTVINAICTYFILRGQERRFHLTSYTGIAAHNISGMTLHSALMLNQKSKHSNSSKTKNDLVSMWQGVDYLFIDEISMVRCKTLVQISDARLIAKEDESIFGGMNIIVAGDLAQLPPVIDNKLFMHIKHFLSSNQQQVSGKLLWLCIDTVVVLHQVWRQHSESNTAFVDVLGRLCTGSCTADDYAMLSSRVLNTNQRPDWTVEPWSTTPLIVSQNDVKDAFNEHLTRSFAEKTGHELHFYYCVDTHKNLLITDNGLHEHLYSLTSSSTSQRLGVLPLVIGMPIMITSNFDVEVGVVNGSTGTLKKICYCQDEQGHRIALSCVVEIPGMSGNKLTELSECHAMAIKDTVDMNFRHPYSGKKCHIRRSQLPIVPGFTFTAHKAQGQTMPMVIVDLNNCQGTETPYVMVSRVQSLEGLLILHPFKMDVITKWPPKEYRKETKRLNML